MDLFGILVSRSVEAAAVMAATAMCLQAEWPEAEVVRRGRHFMSKFCIVCCSCLLYLHNSVQ